MDRMKTGASRNSLSLTSDHCDNNVQLYLQMSWSVNNILSHLLQVFLYYVVFRNFIVYCLLEPYRTVIFIFVAEYEFIWLFQ